MSWLDFSDHERRRISQIIELFQERGTVDDLGIGTVRDAVSDLLFPGTSVLHPRARYFLFVPWIYQRLENDRTAPAEFARIARRREVDLTKALLKSDDTERVIGKQALEGLRMLPSTMYWQGLGAWGVRLFNGSQAQYIRNLPAHYRAADRKDDVDERATAVANWHPRLPARPKGFPDGADLKLRREEAQFLRDQIRRHAPGTLLAYLVDGLPPADPVEFPWLHPSVGDAPAPVRTMLDHAQCFSEAMHGAALLYNLLLSRAKKQKEWLADYEELIEQWAAGITKRKAAMTRWNRAEFWQAVLRTNPRIKERTRAFVETWIGLALGANPGKLARSAEAERVITERERIMKRALARLQNPRALDMYTGGAGAGQLDFRWGIIQHVVLDIQRGLGADA